MELLLQEYLEINGFFIYLFAVSDVYFVFVIYQVLTARHDENGKLRIVENEKVKITSGFKRKIQRGLVSRNQIV